MSRGRKPTTGCFDTREELEDKVMFLYHFTASSVDQIAKHCDISSTTVYSIVDKCAPQYLANRRGN